MTLPALTEMALTIGHKPEADPYPKWNGVWAVKEWHRLGATAFDCDTNLSADGTAWAIHWSEWWKHGIVVKPGLTPVPHKQIGGLTDAEIRRLVHKDGWELNTVREVMEAAAPLGITVCLEAKYQARLEERAYWRAIKADALEVGCAIVAMTIQNYPNETRARARLAAAHAEGIPTLLLTRGPISAEWWEVLDGAKGSAYQVGKVPAGKVRLGLSPASATKYGCSCSPSSAKATTAKVLKLGGVQVSERLGVDYSLARPNPAAMKAAKVEAVGRYISPPGGVNKDLSKAEADALHAAELGIWLVWESTAHRAADGAAAGAADVKAAEAAADALGYPRTAVIFYAVDFDATPAAVAAYFAAVRKAAKRPVGVYGGFRIAEADLAPYVWQTAAWSGGRLSTKAHIHQLTTHSVSIAGSKADDWDENVILRDFPMWTAGETANNNEEEVPMTSAQRIISVAKGEAGYHEGRSGGHWNNHQKYSPAVPGLEWSQNQAWCATFVSWCAMKAKLGDLYPRTASCDVAAAWFKSRGRWSEYPAIGAQVFYGHPSDLNHTGIVYDYDGTYVYTVEGNTNVNGSREGDGVYLKKRRRRDPGLIGYGYPKFPEGIKSADPRYKNQAPKPAPKPKPKHRAEVSPLSAAISALARKFKVGNVGVAEQALRNASKTARPVNQPAINKALDALKEIQ